MSLALELKGKVAVVTGGGSGINQRIAERFAQQGARVALIGRTQEKLDKVAKDIQQNGGKAVGYSADVRDYEALVTIMTNVASQYGAIHVLVCGAAGNFPASASSMSANAFKSVVDIDLLGTFNTARAAFDHLAKPGASIINISAPQAFQAIPMQSHVNAAKAGVDMITRTLAVEWGPLGVRINSIVPGAVEGTEGINRLAPQGPIRDRLTARIPLQRLAQKDDIADLALFLCGPAAKYITGSVIPCDGGLTVAGAMFHMLEE